MSEIAEVDLKWCVEVIRRATNNRAGITELKAVTLQVEDAAAELARLRRIESAAQKVARYAPFVKRSYYARILAEEVRELAAALEAK